MNAKVDIAVPAELLVTAIVSSVLLDDPPLLLFDTANISNMASEINKFTNLGSIFIEQEYQPSSRMVKHMATEGYFINSYQRTLDGNYETQQAPHKARVIPDLRPSYAGESNASVDTRMAEYIQNYNNSRRINHDDTAVIPKRDPNPRFLKSCPLIDSLVEGTAWTHAYTEGRPVEFPEAQRFRFG